MDTNQNPQTNPVPDENTNQDDSAINEIMSLEPESVPISQADLAQAEVANAEVSRSQESKRVRWKCRNCGYQYEGYERLEACPNCGKDSSYFEDVD